MPRQTRFGNPERTYDELVAEISNLVGAVEDVFTAATEGGSEKLSELKGEAEGTLKKVKAQLGALERDVVSKARSIASDPDDYVRENPWTAICLGAGIGLLLGLLIGRK
jgi:ElaB/YqjD/DUF883 family membrane-anchored ribosome-binding protein